ncbi:AmmeMemoRadiSam system protein B [bacterium]|nr:AmmeMemoRadiSam system protein B [bacterium]
MNSVLTSWLILLLTLSFSMIICYPLLGEEADFSSITGYSGSLSELSGFIDELLEKSPESGGVADAIIVPFDKILFSGGVAACAYRFINPYDFNRVIILAPPKVNPISRPVVCEEEFFNTPIGIVRLDLAAAKRAKRYCNTASCSQEPGVLAQLPFIQERLGNVEYLAILVPEDSSRARLIGKFIRQEATIGKPLIVASVLLGEGLSTESGSRNDGEVISILKEFSPTSVARIFSPNYFVTGKGVLFALSCAFPKEVGASLELLNYSSSSQILGRNQPHTGYIAAAITSEKERASTSFSISDDEKKYILNTAKEAIQLTLNGERPVVRGSAYPVMNRQAGVIVELSNGEVIYGVASELLPRRPLYKTLVRVAANAATCDPMHNPVQASDLSHISVKVILLVNIEEVNSIDEIEIGRDGLIAKRLDKLGANLPDVAVKNGWRPLTFVRRTCMKAGLPSSCFEDGDAQLFKFQVIEVKE